MNELLIYLDICIYKRNAYIARIFRNGMNETGERIP